MTASRSALAVRAAVAPRAIPLELPVRAWAALHAVDLPPPMLAAKALGAKILRAAMLAAVALRTHILRAAVLATVAFGASILRAAMLADVDLHPPLLTAALLQAPTRATAGEPCWNASGLLTTFACNWAVERERVGVLKAPSECPRGASPRACARSRTVEAPPAR
eukprot:CAMPEP_0171243280 /NCGR_PEP_ID=MMETSP0790-20130122/46201_1 /TAXON_ID=2925 /ORGANISM="Alexandrium catenella, Strain OF101" /LENGTH=164 /DNA_ID=CAMNT_0011710259 /DNA_START=203 /DNA_END=695 /DNA_ORIENTATION=+